MFAVGLSAMLLIRTSGRPVRLNGLIRRWAAVKEGLHYVWPGWRC